MKPPIKTLIFFNFPGAKSKIMPKCIPIGFQMAEKKVYGQTDRQTLSYLYKQRCIFLKKCSYQVRYDDVYD